jgi:hypothetical protein
MTFLPKVNWWHLIVIAAVTAIVWHVVDIVWKSKVETL